MEPIQQQPRLFLELRQRLKSGLIVLRADVAGDPADVSVYSGDGSLLIKTSTELLCSLLPPGLALVPGSTRVVPTSSGDGLHLRLCLQVDQHTEAPGSVLGRLQVGQAYRFCCQRCGQVLLLGRTFQRVLPLPNGNWNALVEDWCCHPDPFANKKLVPRQGDCLLGDTFFLLPRDGDCDAHVIQETAPPDVIHSANATQKACRTEVLMCRSCRAVLGEALSAETLKLYITEVTVRQSSEDSVQDMTEHRSCFLARTLACRLVELSCVQSIFRFAIQAPNGKVFVLLWLLNTDTLLACLSDFAANGNRVMSPRDGLCDVHQSCHVESAVKVLYIPCIPSIHQDVTDAWEKDVGVHALTLPQPTCLEVIKLLNMSTCSLPPSLQTMNSFQVAFLSL